MKKTASLTGLATIVYLLTGLHSAIAQTPAAATPAATTPANMHIIRVSTQPAAQGAASNFTGDVSVNRLFPANDPLNTSGGYVTFAPCARTAWHTHPHGQLLIITSGGGRVQQWGGSVEEVQEGDVVWFPANVKHWHGAQPDKGMTHIALAQIVDGKAVEWMELVSDEQYNGQ